MNSSLLEMLEIDFQKLADTHKSGDSIDQKAIDSLTTDKTKFNTPLSKWCSLSESDNFQTSTHNHYTSSVVSASKTGSNALSQSSSKHHDALIKLKLVELKAQQSEERKEDDFYCAQREVEHKVQATLKLKLLDMKVNRNNDENKRYEVAKPVKIHHTNQKCGSKQ